MAALQQPSDSPLFQRMKAQQEQREAEAEAEAAQEKADEDWEAARDASGRLYYYNASTQQTAWELPSAGGKPVAAQPAKPNAATVAGAAQSEDSGAALAQAVAAIQQLTADVTQQREHSAELEQKLSAALASQGAEGNSEKLQAALERTKTVYLEKKQALSELKALQETHEELESARDALQGENDTLKAQAALAALGAEAKDALKAQLQEEVAAVAKFEKELEAAQGENEALKAQLEEETAGAATKQEEQEVLQAENETLKAQLAEAKLHAERPARPAPRGEAGQGEAKLDAEAKLLQLELGGSARAEGASEGDGASEQVKALADEKEALTRERDELLSTATELRETVERLQAELAAEKEQAQAGASSAEKEQLQAAVDGAKARAEKLFAERKEALEQRDGLRAQLAKVTGQSNDRVLQPLAVENPESTLAATIGLEDALDLISGIHTEQDARDVCKEVGIRSDTALPMEAMVAALKGHYDKSLTLEQVFVEQDTEESGFLDDVEVQAACAMMGFLIEPDKLADAVVAMNPGTAWKEGDGTVTLPQFKSWWERNMADDMDVETKMRQDRAERTELVGAVAALKEQLQQAAERTSALSSDFDASLEANTQLQESVEKLSLERDKFRQQLASSVKGSARLQRVAVAGAGPSENAEDAVGLLDLLSSAEDARELCDEEGLQLDPEMPMEAMVAALKGHYDRSRTVEQVFAEIDADGSGFLDISEVQASIAMLGFSCAPGTLDDVFLEMDPDGNGQVSFDEFQSWWAANMQDGEAGEEVARLEKEVAALKAKVGYLERLSSRSGAGDGRSKLRRVSKRDDAGGSADVADAAGLLDLLEDEEEAAELCRESGLDLSTGDAGLETMKAALKGHFSGQAGQALSMAEVFAELDVDSSGYLDEQEVQCAVAMLGFLVEPGSVEVVMAEMDPDGDGKVTQEEFAKWWAANAEQSDGAPSGDSIPEGVPGVDAEKAELEETVKRLQEELSAEREKAQADAARKQEEAAAAASAAAGAEATEAAAQAVTELQQALERVQAELEVEKERAETASKNFESTMNSMDEVIAQHTALEKKLQATVEQRDAEAKELRQQLASLGGEGLSKVQEWMEKALRAEATLEVVTRERDTAQASLAAGGGQPEPPSTAKRRTTSYDSDEEDDLRETVDMLESVINARDAEVLKVTEKLKEFGAEMKTLVEQLGAETAKNAELQSENSKLLAELEAVETKLDQMARLNRDLVAQTTELKTRLHSHHTGKSDEV